MPAVVRPDGARTLAGYTLGARLGTDIYGELHAGTGEGGREVQVLVVAPGLAGDRAFSDRLTLDAAPRLHRFSHRAVVGTVLVAREGKELVVVTEPVVDARSVVDLLAAAKGAGGGLAPRVVAAIGQAVIDGLASAHATGLVHGAVHPRSVLLDRHGAVWLTDLAVGFAAISAAAAGSEAMPLRGLTGFIAPEVALGDAPTSAADVHGIGALMHAMVSGDVATGPVATTPALGRLVLRALETDLHRRFASAVELQENFGEALEDDHCVPATASELAALWATATAALTAPSSKPTDAIDRATEDLLASLDGVVEVSRPGGGDGTAPSVAVAGRRLRNTNALDAILFDLDEDEKGTPEVEAVPASPIPTPTPITIPSPTPISITIPGPPPTPIPITISDPTPTPMPAPSPTPPRALTADPIATTAARPIARVATSIPAPVVHAPPTLQGRGFGWLWLTLLAIGGAALAFALVRQKGELTAGEKAARDRKAVARAEQEDLERRLRAAQADPGAVRVHSRPDNAGVWLLLGRAPFESISLRTDQAWELRVELDGYQARDLRVGARGWQGADNTRHAALDVALDPGTLARPLPAIPAEPPADEARGVSGAGRLAVTSTPPGAAVWLLVGVTDTMELDGIEAGRDYELKVTKDGFAPGFVRFAADDWRAGGDPALPLSAAPKRPLLERTVELAAAPRSGKVR